jgi:hypothetical protein
MGKEKKERKIEQGNGQKPRLKMGRNSGSLG